MNNDLNEHDFFIEKNFFPHFLPFFSNLNFDLGFFSDPILSEQVDNKYVFPGVLNNNLKTLKFTLAETYSMKQNDLKNDKERVTYNFNNEYFRCDDFIQTHQSKHILFGGCSETEGVGGNIDEAWSKILYEKITKTENCSGFFLLARSGWGWMQLIINSLVYFRKYGYPEHYFILLPNNQRKYIYDRDTDRFLYEQIYPSYYFKNDNFKNVNYRIPKSNNIEYKTDFMMFIVMWKMFLDICEDNKVKVLFSTWDRLDHNNIKNSNIFDNFIETNNNVEIAEKFKKTGKEYSKYSLTKRDGHAGTLIHEDWADTFYKGYKNEI